MNENYVYDTDHKFPNASIEWFSVVSDPQHGVEGHIGFRCGECAEASENMCQVAPTSADYWQTKQIRWQELVDISLRAFDDSVAAHFPDHKAVDCPDCPVPLALPQKPVSPTERAVSQAK